MHSIGNIEILKRHKTAFLCSRQVPALIVLQCYDWAIARRDAGECVISGFHSAMEKDVMHYLLKGSQPIILAMARGLKQKTDPHLLPHIDNGRLLVLSPFEKEVTRVTEQTSYLRNKMMMELADEIVVGFMHPDGQLQRLVYEFEGIKKIHNLHTKGPE